MFSCHGYRGFRKGGYAFLFVLLSAALDEFHQSFIPGRGPSVKDVGIDMMGFVFSSIFFIAKKSNLFYDGTMKQVDKDDIDGTNITTNFK